MEMAAIIKLLVLVSVMLAVFGLGLKATWQDAVFLARNPGLLLRSILAMNVAMPLFTAGLCALLGILPPVETALLVLMVSPVPPILPFKQTRLGCEQSYVYGLLTAQAILAVILVPLSVWLAGDYYGIDIHMSAGTVGRIVLLTMLLPLAAGIGLRAVLPRFAEHSTDLIIKLGFLLLVLALAPVLVTESRALLAMVGNGTVLAMTLVSIFGLAAGHILGGPDLDHRGTLALATSMRHPAVAIAIVAANHGDVKHVLTAVILYLLVNTILTMIYMKWFKHWRIAHPNVFSREGS
jgi:BASS family bile acid:Na+ symporter